MNDDNRLDAIKERRRQQDESAYSYDDIDFLLARLEEAETQLSWTKLISEAGESALNTTLGEIQKAERKRMIKMVQAVAADATGKLGMVPGNAAFENGRKKAADEIVTTLEAIE